MELTSAERKEPSEKIEEWESMIDGEIKPKHETFKYRLLKDKKFRLKIFIWMILCWSFIVLGWVMSQLGPSLLDLQQITRSTLEEASLFVTATFIGYLTGAIISGAIFERINGHLLLFISLIIMASSSAAIPFCMFYEVMTFMHILKGIGAGILDSAGNSLLMLTIRAEKSARSYLQTLHFTFALGGILSPIATAPFLLPNIPQIINNTNINSSVDRNISWIPHIIENTSDDSSYNQTLYGSQQNSELYKAYLVSAILCVTAAMPFLYMCCKLESQVVTHEKSTESKANTDQNLPLYLRIILLSLMSLFIGTDNGMEDTYFGFFTTYTVKQFSWSKSKGSYASSVYWAAYAIGRFSAIFIAQNLKPSRLLRIYINILLSAELGLFLSTYFSFDAGIWIFSPVIGFAISVFFPSIFLWTEEDFVPVNGRVASLLMFSASLGSMINPIIIGYLMDNLSPRWFMYITMGQAVALLLMTWIATVFSRYVKKYGIHDEVIIDVNEN